MRNKRHPIIETRRMTTAVPVEPPRPALLGPPPADIDSASEHPGHPMSQMDEPTRDDLASSLITCLWQGRMIVSEAERAVSQPGDHARLPAMCADAQAFGRAAASLCHVLAAERAGHQCRIAAEAARTAQGHAAVAVACDERVRALPPLTQESAFYEHIAQKARFTARKSAEYAREEFHRALAACAAQYPHAFPRIDDEDEDEA